MGKRSVVAYGDRVVARTALARRLQEPANSTRRTEAGLTEEDLNIIVTKGEEAETADREQHTQMASLRVVSGTLIELRDKVDAEVEKLRNRCPAVVMDLVSNPDTAAQGEWLAALSFKQFRVRSLSGEPPTGAAGATPAAPVDATPAGSPDATQYVERTDRFSMAKANLQFAAALLEPERAPIVEAMAKRGMGRDRIAAIARDAQVVVDNLGGTLKKKTKDATQREAAAVKAQKDRWIACRRLIREAIHGDADLETLYARC